MTDRCDENVLPQCNDPVCGLWSTDGCVTVRSQANWLLRRIVMNPVSGHWSDTSVMLDNDEEEELRSTNVQDEDQYKCSTTWRNDANGASVALVAELDDDDYDA